MNTAELLLRQTPERADQPAIIEPARHGRERRTTFAALERASRRAADTLRGAGLKPGDAVLLLVPMSAELYAAVLGILRMGAVVMLLDPSAGLKHVRRCCRLRPPDALVAVPKAHVLRLLSAAVRKIPRKFSAGAWLPGAARWDPWNQGEAPADVHPCPPDTPALLTFTSGSTGQPKAAVRTHGLLSAQHAALSRSLGLAAGETDLTTLPVFVLANLASGVTSLLPDADLRSPGRIEPGPVVEQVLRHGATTTAASPALLDRLADECLRRNVTLPSFRALFTGGAPVFPRLMRKLQKVAPQARVVAVYGSTEAEPIAKAGLDEMSDADLGASVGGAGLPAGTPVAEVRLRIHPDRWGEPLGPYTAEAFESLCLPPGGRGEIVVSGDHVLPGYLDGQGDAQTKFRVGQTVWHRTGDAGYLDERGRLWLLGRCGAKIVDEHGTTYPFAVEAAAQDHPGVARAAFVPHQGRRLLVVQPTRAAAGRGEGESIRSTLEQSLRWAHVDAVRLAGAIPVDSRHNAKIDYPALRRLLDGMPDETKP